MLVNPTQVLCVRGMVAYRGEVGLESSPAASRTMPMAALGSPYYSNKCRCQVKCKCNALSFGVIVVSVRDRKHAAPSSLAFIKSIHATTSSLSGKLNRYGSGPCPGSSVVSIVFGVSQAACCGCGIRNAIRFGNLIDRNL